jgi:hypothetical protein
MRHHSLDRTKTSDEEHETSQAWIPSGSLTTVGMIHLEHDKTLQMKRAPDEVEAIDISPRFSKFSMFLLAEVVHPEM